MRVEITKAADGQRDIVIAVEKPETLAMLRHDRPHLVTALNRAGVATDPARIQLDLAPPGSFQERAEQPRAVAAAPAPAADGFMAGGGADGGGGGGQPRRQAPDLRLPPPAPWAEDPGTARLLRGALDITA